MNNHCILNSYQKTILEGTSISCSIKKQIIKIQEINNLLNIKKVQKKKNSIFLVTNQLTKLIQKSIKKSKIIMQIFKTKITKIIRITLKI